MPASSSPEYVEVVQVVVQVCVPTQEVFFEEVKVDLSGIPKAKTLVEQREANGIHGHRQYPSDASTKMEEQGDTEVVRRWIPHSGPQALSRYYLPFGEILNRDGILSAGKSSIYLASNTDKNQPVFEIHGHRVQDYIALETSVEVEKDGQHEFVKYWFRLPKELHKNHFTDWIMPVSQENTASRENQPFPTFWNLTHDRDMDIHPVDAYAPKMRFKLMSVRDYYDDNRFWLRANKAVADKYYKGLSQEEREKVKFVPKRRQAIPGC